MAVYIVTGKLGGGKSLVSVSRIRDKIISGGKIATNLDLKLENMLHSNARDLTVLRVPDKPTINDLNSIGTGNDTYDESKNGLLVLDECGTWFNSRNWNDKDRKPVNDWFLHARKLGWDVLLIIQDVTLLDSQARAAIAEMTAFCRRTDRVAVPIIGGLFQAFTGSKMPMPRVHSARVVYGISSQDPLSERWVYRGTELYSAYDTKQIFLEDYPNGLYSYLTPWHVKGRYQVPRNLEFYMRLSRIYWKRFKSPVAMAAGVLFGVAMSLLVVMGSVNSAPDLAPEPIDPEPAEQTVEPDSFLPPEKGVVIGESDYVYRHTPRIQDVPYSAPVYDEAVEIVSFPRPQCFKWKTGQNKGRCSCVTQQASPLDISPASCENYVKHGYFEPYLKDRALELANSDDIAVPQTFVASTTKKRSVLIGHKPRPRQSFTRSKPSKPSSDTKFPRSSGGVW